LSESAPQELHPEIAFFGKFYLIRYCKLYDILFSFLAYPVEDPMIEGVLSTYAIGDQVNANCTSGKSNPPAVIAWAINGVKVCIVDLRAVLYLSYSHDIIKITYVFFLMLVSGS
jgi:hypothetical protein